ncbi:unnamed protein product [Bursaphelenchus okinawaensis]|uniref:ABC transporter domain-containing protein n=1 Tax=Bursaphelenchus okinawaensis TaxID=465554 RepID=A0A811KK77_9BILA|nr:unnamed protein product [Bursaphelenchus okinawaensis]CAG9106318.1 unnamed protein product [Bursaphelenchus okinawaensis]
MDLSLSTVPKSVVLVSPSLSSKIKTMFSKVSDQFEFVETEYDEYAKLDGYSQFDYLPKSFGFFEKDGQHRFYASAFLHQGFMLAINVYYNMVFGDDTMDHIRVGYVDTSKVKENKSPLNNLIESLVTSFAISFGLAMIMSSVIVERVKKFKHQIYLASAKTFIYWLAQLLSDFTFYFVLVTFVFVCYLLVAKPLPLCALGIVPFYFLYFFSGLFLCYVLSLGFESPTKATVIILAVHAVIPLILHFCIILFVHEAGRLLSGFSDQAMYFRAMLSVFLPTLGLVTAQDALSEVCVAKADLSASMYTDSKKVGMTLGSLFLSSVVYLSILLLIETKMLKRKQKEENPGNEDEEDADVAEERDRINGISGEELALAVRNLSKNYGTKWAVQGLSFGMNSNECFGLLGTNGAGKTTTFDMLTNQTSASDGSASILGTPVEQTPTIGYCPQFDSLSDNLTGRETLTLLGRLNGFKSVKDRVELVLECVFLSEMADELTKTYSGGQKRRLSIAVCLMSGSKFLVLDEPTAGVDPATRRHIWDLLIAMRNLNKAILLTTHSMEECEALCTRIGFLRAGRLRGIGTSQHLKSSYGNSYVLTIILKSLKKEDAEYVNKVVSKAFDISPSTDLDQRSISFDIPKKSDVSWSSIYEKVEGVVREINSQRKSKTADSKESQESKERVASKEEEIVSDFYLVQNSLEQVFTRLATAK